MSSDEKPIPPAGTTAADPAAELRANESAGLAGAPATSPPPHGGGYALESHTELLLLPDGRVLVHNLTPAMAQILQKLDPGDRLIQQRGLPASTGIPPATAHELSD